MVDWLADLGYYDIWYIGDEVKDPGRTIPRSIIISVIAVAIIYFAINLSIIGVVPWREFVPYEAHPESGFVVSLMMEKIYGAKIATVFTAMVLWTAFGSVFALLLGYSRIPFVLADDGLLPRTLAKLDKRGTPRNAVIISAIFYSIFDFDYLQFLLA